MSLREFLFPKWVWNHPSARLDLRFVVINNGIFAVLAGLGGVAALAWFGGGSADAEGLADTNTGLLVVAYTVVLVIVHDFVRYWAHRLMHKVPLLWAFHRVHHSPQALNPFSVLRNHPVNSIINGLRSVVSTVITSILFLPFIGSGIGVVEILGANAVRFLFNVAGSHLRHSHIWLYFGPVIGRVIISPAQHQIHHSADPRHFDKNFSSQFALWDWMFGTLYLPEGKEKLSFGLGRGETDFKGVGDIYLEPFRRARQLLRDNRDAWRRCATG